MAKFQASSSFRSQLLFENVILRYRDLKTFGLFLAKIDLFSVNISKNLLIIPVFVIFLWFSTWKYMKNQQKQSLTAFLATENHYLEHL